MDRRVVVAFDRGGSNAAVEGDDLVAVLRMVDSTQQSVRTRPRAMVVMSLTRPEGTFIRRSAIPPPGGLVGEEELPSEDD